MMDIGILPLVRQTYRRCCTGWFPLDISSRGLLPALFLIGALAIPQLMPAQTRFATPDTAADLSQYRTPHECFAAFQRITYEATFKGPWLDTILYEPSERNRPYPEEAMKAIRSCMHKFSIAEVGADELTSIWVRALVLAGRDTDANTLARRDIATAPADSQRSVHRQALLRLQTAYSAVRPIPVQRLQALDRELLPLIDSDEVADWKVRSFQQWKSLYEILGDSASRLQAAQTFLNDVAKDSANFRRSSASASAIMEALTVIHHDELMDSLRKGSDAYLALIRSYWAYASGTSGRTVPNAVGQQAPDLLGDYWFSSRDKTHTTATTAAGLSLPKRDAVNLVVFIRGCRGDKPLGFGKGRRATGVPSACWGQYATLRRLATRYPNLEVTLVTRTIGYVGEMNPMPPKEEAALLRKWWLEFHKLPVNLVVRETQYFRLKEPDGRRIDEIDINRDNYAFGDLLAKTMRLIDVFGFLVDTNGRVIYASQINRVSEPEFRNLLDVMMSRSTKLATTP